MHLKQQQEKIQTIEKITIGEFEISKKNVVAQELIDTLYTKEEVELLNKGINAYEITLLNNLFHKEYIIKEFQNILDRIKKYNDFLTRLSCQGNEPRNEIITARGYPRDSAHNTRDSRDIVKKCLTPHNKKIDNGILIDLFSKSNMIDLFKMDKKNYIFSPRKIIHVDLGTENSNNLTYRKIDESYIKDEALRFISLLPDDSVHYLLSGIDDCIIKGDTDYGKKYLYFLISEIYRTTKKGGIVTGIDFDRNQLLGDKGMKNRGESKKSYLDFYCYEKE